MSLSYVSYFIKTNNLLLYPRINLEISMLNIAIVEDETKIENTTTNVSGTAVVENIVTETKTTTASKTKDAEKLKFFCMRSVNIT